jgi:hypothetical protein
MDSYDFGHAACRSGKRISNSLGPNELLVRHVRQPQPGIQPLCGTGQCVWQFLGFFRLWHGRHGRAWRHGRHGRTGWVRIGFANGRGNEPTRWQSGWATASGGRFRRGHVPAVEWTGLRRRAAGREWRRPGSRHARVRHIRHARAWPGRFLVDAKQPVVAEPQWSRRHERQQPQFGSGPHHTVDEHRAPFRPCAADQFVADPAACWFAGDPLADAEPG